MTTYLKLFRQMWPLSKLFARGARPPAIEVEHDYRNASSAAAEPNPTPMATDIETVRRHVAQVVGPIEVVLLEQVSDTIRLELLVVPPARHRPFYSVITCGMSAWKMIPSASAQEGGVFLSRIELSICLSPTWNLEMETLRSDEDYHWPLRLLKDLARLPLTFGTSLGVGHTVALRDLESYAPSTKFCAALVGYPALFGRKPTVKSNLGDITFLHDIET